MELAERIRQVAREAEEALTACDDPGELEALRVKYLGRKGALTLLLREIGKLPPEERPEAGRAGSEAKRRLEGLLGEKREALAKKAKGRALDVTLPGRRPPLGKRHPLTQIIDEIVDIFRGMGFEVVEGPEIETEYHNFDALNTPPDHPARDLHDTFYVEDGRLLRTHTSPVQIRVMESRRPPLRIISPGRCYRNDTPDATHSPIFHQVEGLYVDKDVSFADLKGVIAAFARQMFGPDVKVRFRPDFFPFTEPSAEYSFSCVFCKGKGCRVCKYTGWLEISGAGMVDPEVFKNVGYDPEEYTGFAFGMGVERLAMLKYGITDIRLFLENDLRFLEQF